MSQPSTEPITTPPAPGQGPTGTPAAPAQTGATGPAGWDGPFDADRARKAIDAERATSAAAREKARKYDELQQAQLSDVERHQTAAATEKARADKAELTIARLEAGLEHGLTKAQASRLTGNTPEEILADGAAFAQELGIVKADPAAAPVGEETPPEKDITGNRRTPTQQPVVTPRGGGNPSAEPEPDLEKIANEIPR